MKSIEETDVRAQRVISETELRHALDLPQDVEIAFTQAYPLTRAVSIHLSGPEASMRKYVSESQFAYGDMLNAEAPIVGAYSMPIKAVPTYGKG